MPLAGPAAALSVPAGVVYGTGRIDASGRVADRAVTCALGWREGDRLDRPFVELAYSQGWNHAHYQLAQFRLRRRPRVRRAHRSRQ